MRLRRTALLAFLATMILTPLAPAQAAPVPTPGFPASVPLFNAAGLSTNGSEPSIHVDSKDNVYVSAPAGVPTGGCPFWSVTPDKVNAAGKPYEYRGTIDTDHASAGGGDCDISSTPAPGPFDSVSVTSLSLANLTSNVTTDGGETFATVANPASQQVFGVDRQWQAADEALGRHYLTVHDLATVNIQFSVSTDGGYQYVQNTPAINPATNRKALSTGGVSFGAVSGGNHFGPTVVDPATHKVYIPFLAPKEGTTGFKEHALYISEGDPCATIPCTPGGTVGPISWTTYLAFEAPVTANLANDFPVLTIDRAGRLYAAFTGDVTKAANAGTGYDASHIFLVRATTPGSAASWSAPQMIDPGTGNANIFPWLVAGNAGNVGVAWYSSTLASSGPCPGAGAAGNGTSVSDNCLNLWRVSYAQSSEADQGGAEWSVSDVSGLIHRGPVCNKGLSCASGTRTLLDFFDVAVDGSGRPHFAYVSDTRILNTADVQYTRQCTGTTLTGVSLPSTCAPLGSAPATCEADARYLDPAGDATNVLGTPTPLPNDKALDVVSGSLATTADGVIFSVHLNDLTSTPTGQIIEQYFKIAGKEYYVRAQRATGTGVISYVYGDMTGTSGGRKQLGTTTGSLSDETDVVTTLFPRAALTPALADGTVISGINVTTRRDGGALIPDADVAVNPCPYTVGASAPEVIVPEVPYAVLVPVVAAGAFGAVLYRRRRLAA